MSRGAKRPATIGRRGFFKAAGSMATALATGPLLLTGDTPGATLVKAAPTRDTLRIGLLLPQSQIYPTLGSNLLGGMRLYFGQAGNLAGGRSIELVTETYGVLPTSATAQARKFILSDQVDIVVGMLGSAATVPLHDLLRERNIPMIVANVGANIARSRAQSPYIFHNSLNAWQANWATGDWAARNLGKTALIASSFYESGYDTIYSFGRGFESAGGAILDTQVTHRPEGAGNVYDLIAVIERTHPDMVFAAYSGRPAADFLRAYGESGLSGRIPLVGAGFILNEGTPTTSSGAAPDLIGGLGWSSYLDTPENSQFISAFQAQTGRPADAFAILGYDTAQLIDVASSAAGDPRRIDHFRQALGSARFASPRGMLTMDPQTLSMSGPLYLRTVDRRGANDRVAELEPIAGLDQVISPARMSPKTGWLNAYMCI